MHFQGRRWRRPWNASRGFRGLIGHRLRPRRSRLGLQGAVCVRRVDLTRQLLRASSASQPTASAAREVFGDQGSEGAREGGRGDQRRGDEATIRARSASEGQREGEATRQRGDEATIRARSASERRHPRPPVLSPVSCLLPRVSGLLSFHPLSTIHYAPGSVVQSSALRLWDRRLACQARGGVGRWECGKVTCGQGDHDHLGDDHLPIMSAFAWRAPKVIIVSRRATGV